MPDKRPPVGLITALRHAPLAALVVTVPTATAVVPAEPDAAELAAPAETLQARVAAVRAALALQAPAEPDAFYQPNLAQSPNWTNWPKWSKWSNWANK